MQHILDTSNLSGLLYIPSTDEPDVASFGQTCSSAVFLGYSKVYSMPVLITPATLLNQHFLIIGMTGSGKSFLARNLILRLSVVHGSKIILIDFSGEYKNMLDPEFMKAESGTFPSLERQVSYFDLTQKPEAERMRLASEILSNLVLLMRHRKIEAGEQAFVVIDEAWKLLASDKNLEVIIREGRKYRIGLILSSQLIEDADIAITSNISTLLLFRTQDKNSLELVRKNYGISEVEIESIQNLNLGACLIVQLHKSNYRSAYQVKRILGIDTVTMLKIKTGDNMSKEISINQLRHLIRTASNGKEEEILVQTRQRGSIRLETLVQQLLAAGSDKHEVLCQLRKLGFCDTELSDAFASAIASR